MEPNDIFRKTARGQAALKDRQILSDPRLRAILIMIDGHRAVHQLSTVGAAVAPMLESLAEQGLIERAVAAAPPPPPPPVASAAAAAPDQGHSGETSGFPSLLVDADDVQTPGTVSAAQLGQAKRQASRWLMDAAGPAAEALCIKIESARTADDLMTQTTRAQALITSLRGAAAGIKYVTDVMAVLKGP